MTDQPGSSPHVARNRAGWDQIAEHYQRDHDEQLHTGEPGWGVWDIPESELGVLGDVAGKDILEFGCGAAGWSVKLARLGARPVGFDLSGEQLRHARRLVARTGVRIPLVQADAERVPFKAESFDIVFCDHGAMRFVEPERGVAEAARVLRSGGIFAFNVSSPLFQVCSPYEDETVTERLIRPYFEMRRIEWDVPDWRITEFQVPYGEWIRIFRRNGVQVEDLVELRPPGDAKTTYTDYAPLEWARKWPGENIWVARKE